MNEAKKQLLDSFKWIKVDGHLKHPEITDDVFEFCKEHGYMFDPPKPETHEESYSKLCTLLSKIDAEDVANAFLYSLSTRDLEYRSALGSYYYAVAIPNHECYGNPNFRCNICGWSNWTSGTQDRHSGLNLLSFLRCHYGSGGYGLSMHYALFDLEQFIKLPKVTPTEDDIKIFKQLLSCVSELEPGKKIGALQKLITSKKIIKSNKGELQTLLGILGVCGVLSSKEHPCYIERFTYYDGSRDPVESKNDYDYPVNRWRSEDGINIERLHAVFGDKIDW